MNPSLAIGMTCCPRAPEGRPLDYTKRSILSFRKCGFREPLHLFCEPGEILLPDPKANKLHRLTNIETRGCFQNWRHGLTYLVENAPAKWYLMLQDDAIFSSRVPEKLDAAMRNTQLAKVGFLSPYTSPSMVHRHAKGGWVDAKFHNGSFWGAVAILLPHDSATYLLNCESFINHTHHRKIDIELGRCFKAANRRILMHVPSLLDHIGTWSTLGRHKIKNIAWGRRGFKFGQP